MAQRLAAFAFIFALIAGYFIYTAIALDTSVEGTANLQLMHVQAMKVALGVGASVVAAIFAAAAAIISSRS